MRSGSGDKSTELANDVWGDIAVPFPRLPLGRHISPLFESNNKKASPKRNATPSPDDIPASSGTEPNQLGSPAAGRDANARRTRAKAKSFIPTSFLGESKPLPMPSTHVPRTDSEKVLDLELSKAYYIENQMAARRRIHTERLSGLRRSAPPGQISCSEGFELRRSKRSKTDLTSTTAQTSIPSTPERKSSLASLTRATQGSAMSLTSTRDMSGIFSIDM